MRVLVLGEGTDIKSVEDFVAPTVMVAAIEDVVTASRARGSIPDVSEVPSYGRARWAEQVLADAGIPKARTRLALACLSKAPLGGLLDPERVSHMRALLGAIQERLPG